MFNFFVSFFLLFSLIDSHRPRRRRFPCDVVASSSFVGLSEIDYVTTSTNAVIEVQIFNRFLLYTKRRKRTPVMFVHGGLQSRQTWSGTLQCLDIRDRVVLVPSLRGHGDSQVFPSSNFTRQEFVSDLIDVLDFYNIPSAIWIGHSLGSLVTYQAASTNNELTGNAANSASYVKSFVIVGSGPGPEEAVCNGVGGFVSQFGDCLDRSLLLAYSQFSGSLAAANDIRLTNQYLRETYKCPPDMLLFLLSDICGFDATINVLPAITQKVTIIYGTLDFAFTRAQQDILINSLTNAEKVRYVEFNNTGHEVFWENVQRFSNVIRRHIYYY